MPTTTEPYNLSVLEIVRGIDAQTLRVEVLVESLLEVVAERDAQIGAWAHLERDTVLAAARRLDSSTSRGPLRGVPFGVKDNIDTHDMPTGYGSSIHAGKTPLRDAACVALMRGAGALLFGKTVTTEFAHRHPGKTRNPWNLAHTPGGSSSGSAAAVAAGMVPVAFGSQTTGSVIRPAAYCGVVGYKPTFGEFNTSGVIENTPSFDTLGLFARSIDDIALVRAGLLEEPFEPSTVPALAELRVGICRTPFWSQVDADTQVLLDDAAGTLKRVGATLVDFAGDAALGALEEMSRRISGYEFAHSLAHERIHSPQGLSAVLREGRMADGVNTSREDYIRALRGVERARLVHDEHMEGYDVLITPSAPGAAPEGLEDTGSPIFNMPWTTLHTPAITVPAFRTAAGMPIGLQIVARRWADTHLLGCATAIFRALS